MKQLQVNNAARPRQRHTGTEARVQSLTLVLVALLLGIAAGAIWLYRTARTAPANTSSEPAGSPAVTLSESTKAALARLDLPLEIRFYAVLDPATVPDSLTAFAGRASQVLSAYQQEGGGKIKLTSFTSSSDANAAVADGITVFNLDRGPGCYLGLTLTLNGHKETLPHLLPEWEQALEPDLTRAILRLLEAKRPYTGPAAVSQVNTTAVQEVKALIPNLPTVSEEAGRQILQDAALKDYKSAVSEMQTQVQEAEQLLAQAKNGGTDAEQQAAAKHLQQVKDEQSEKLKQIAARSRAQIEALQQIKAAPR